MSVAIYLDQTKIWIDIGSGKLIPIKEMTPDHKYYASRWLYNHAQPLLTMVEHMWHQRAINNVSESDLTTVLRLVSESPRSWIQETRLYKELTKS